MSDPTPQDFADDIEALWKDERDNPVVKAALANPLIHRARPEQIAEMFFGIGVAVVLMARVAAKVEPEPPEAAARTRDGFTPEASEWADDTMLSLEAHLAAPARWAAFTAMGLEYSDYIRAYRRAGEQIDAHLAVLQERHGEFNETTPREIEQMAPRACLAIALSMLTAAKLDAQNARAERDRAERDDESNKCVRCSLPLYGRENADDCRMCDPLCPVWGKQGHLWDGDEESSRAAYLAHVEAIIYPDPGEDIPFGVDIDDDDGSSSRDSEPDR